MSEAPKTVESPVAVETPAVAPAVVEATPAVEPAVETPAAEPTAEAAAPVEAPATEAAAEAAPVEEPKEEPKPIEEGILEAKGSGFPKNFLYTKKFFWFGKESLSAKDLAAYVKSEKATDVAHHVVSWASETGKGLLFYGEKPGDKSAHGVIQLADASEPVPEGTHKFHLTSKGHKHTFKASTTAERDNWINQLKGKIAEAKELAVAVSESEAYKSTLASLKPAKKEAPKETPKEAATAPAEAPVEAEAAVPAPVEVAVETPAAPAAEEAPKEAPKETLAPKEEDKPKRRSASRKRVSIFGGFGKKEEKPVEAEAAKEAEVPAVEAPAAEEAAPAVEAPAAEAEAVAPTVEVAAAATAPAPEVKSPTTKRGSIFGNLGFSKKKAEPEVAPAPPAKDTPVEAPVSETAPVIPAVETSEPLSTEVAAPAAAAPAEVVEEAAPAANGEAKKEVKSDKRKSSLPFTFGKKDKSDDEGEKKSPFSKFRATVRLNRKDKSAAKSDESSEEAAPAEAEAAKEEAPKEEVAAPAEAAPAEAAPAATEEVSEKPVVVAAAPQVAATA